jgi:hypothetical protein
VISVTGHDAVTGAIRDLERARRDLPRQTRKAMREVAPRLVADAKEHGGQVLPRRGGYARQVATQTRFLVEVVSTGQGVILRITAVGPDYRLDKQGRLRHPVYAHGPRSEWNWVKREQKVTPGWFSRPMKINHPTVRGVLVAAGSRAIRG